MNFALGLGAASIEHARRSKADLWGPKTRSEALKGIQAHARTELLSRRTVATGTLRQPTRPEECCCKGFELNRIESKISMILFELKITQHNTTQNPGHDKSGSSSPSAGFRARQRELETPDLRLVDLMLHASI